MVTIFKKPFSLLLLLILVNVLLHEWLIVDLVLKKASDFHRDPTSKIIHFGFWESSSRNSYKKSYFPDTAGCQNIPSIVNI